MFTSKVTDTIAIPGEPGVTVTIRKLSGGAIEEASDAKRDKLLGVMKALDGITLPEGDPEAQAAAGADPANKYDRAVVLQNGVTAWTYDEAVTPTNIADQDEAWQEFVFRAIIAHSLRSPEEGEA